MALKLDGSVDVKRIHEFLTKVLTSGDLANYKVLIDNPSDETSLNVTLEQLLSFASALVKVSTLDSVAGFLENKIVEGANITITKLNPEGDEQLEIAASAGGDPFKIESTSGDSIAEFGTSGAQEFLTVISNLLKVAEFGDGSTHRRLTLDPDDARGINTGLWFGGNDLGVYSATSTTLTIRTLGFIWSFSTAGIVQGNSRARISADNPSAVVPNFIPKSSDADTGIGWAGADQLSLIAGATEVARFLATGMFIKQIKSGATQVAAGAAVDEVWKTVSHATLPDNVLLIGV